MAMPNWERQNAEWNVRWSAGRQRDADAELGRLVRVLLAAGGMIGRFDGDDGPTYLVEIYGPRPSDDGPLVVVQAKDALTALRRALME